VRLTVTPSGAVTGAVVRTSTSPQPGNSTRAAVKTMMGWTFAPINGGEVGVDLSGDSSRATRLRAGAVDSGLAHQGSPPLGATSSPEYAFAPAGPCRPVAPPARSVGTRCRDASASQADGGRLCLGAARPEPMLLEAGAVGAALPIASLTGSMPIPTAVCGDALRQGLRRRPAKRLAVRTARSVSGVTDVIDQTTTDTSVWGRASATDSRRRSPVRG